MLTINELDLGRPSLGLLLTTVLDYVLIFVAEASKNDEVMQRKLDLTP